MPAFFDFDLDCIFADQTRRSVDDRHSVAHHRDPARFFHYTNAPAAWSMLVSDSIRLFDIRQMNDGSELDYYLSSLSFAAGVANRTPKIGQFYESSFGLENMLRGEAPPDPRSTPALTKWRVEPNIHIYNEAVIQGALRIAVDWRNHFKIYSASLTLGRSEYWSSDTEVRAIHSIGVYGEADFKATDDLTLWRGYARDGEGVAVEVGRGDLLIQNEIFYHEQQVSWLIDLLRKMSDWKDRNDELLQDFISQMATTAETGRAERLLLSALRGEVDFRKIIESDFIISRVRYPSSSQIINFLDILFENIDSAICRSFSCGAVPDWVAMKLARLLVALACCHKHPGFCDEKEWRIFHMQPISGETLSGKAETPAREYLEYPLGLNRDQMTNEGGAITPIKRLERMPQFVVLGPGFPDGAIPPQIRALEKSGRIKLQRSTIPFIR